LEKPPTVLLVEDDDSLRRGLARSLGQAGFNVLQAGSGEEALRLAEDFTSELPAVVMDIKLPDAWGASLAQTIRSSHPELSVVYITGEAGDDPVLRSGLRDAHRVLLKPFNPKELVEILKELTG